MNRGTSPWPRQVAADCEVSDGWGFAQDINAWSSLGYVVIGVALAIVVLRRRLPRIFVVFAGLAATEGVGSLLYHGTGGDVAQVLHDGALIAMLGFVAGWQVGRLRSPGAAQVGAAFGATLGTAVGVLAGVVSSAAVTNAMVVGSVAVTAGAELLARRRRHPAIWNAALVAALVVALATWFLGRGDSPLCVARSWAQPHALWHVLSALVLLWWVDRVLDVDLPRQAPRMGRGFVDRALGGLSLLLTHAFYRSLDVEGRSNLVHDRPVLIVANHGNGFVDPILVTAVLRRLPRFLGKAALWKVMVARPMLGLAGALPVYRTSDGDRAADNASSFVECERELARGGTIAIFPEGTTGDRAGLDRVRSGAARIALGSLADAPDMVITPIGLAFESRVATRTRAVAMIGPPIRLADLDDPVTVESLTTEIRVALERVSPEFATVDERETLRAAARVAADARMSTGLASFGEVEILARRLAAAPAAAKAEVTDALGAFALRLQLVGLTSQELGRSPTSWRRLLGALAVVIGFGSIVLSATLIHLPALVGVLIATGLVRSTATKGTVRMLVGLVALLLTWTIAGIVTADGVGAVVVAATVAAGGIIALNVWTPLLNAARSIIGWVRIRDRVNLLPPVLEARARVVESVDRALGTVPR